ncbi:hemagglutinin repeat-containing protein [Aeromonas allosaccharophila]|uniref:Hemagglutinin repeat-containing protein n=1 Tax=Aeromonas allosaccharophila TaxID=656 RepID=A0AAX3NZQ7_9GAMM|nr:hemagglutinin repeat-containing protein [Aeromonas allosaccharophila]WED78931.1 hemagglutinin repeat-containing protein [Aeromonas allosaccharophila]
MGRSRKGAGITIFANLNAAKGKELGNSGRYTETIVTVGDTLTLTSQQDSDHYQSKQSSIVAGGSFTFGTMTGSGYVNASRQKVNSDYQSVVEQTGVFAGQQGFDIRVGEHTQLDGAVLAGSDNASNNRLSTNTLGWGDLHHRADYKVESQSIGISGSGQGGKSTANVIGDNAEALGKRVPHRGTKGRPCRTITCIITKIPKRFIDQSGSGARYETR